MATRAPAGLIDFDAFLRGAEGAQRINMNNQRMARQDIQDDFALRNLLQTDADNSIKRDATTYLSSLPLNRISAIRGGSGMSAADHLIAQRDAIMNDPYFQNNSPEFQQQVLNSLTSSAAVQMQNLNKTGDINNVARLADAFGQTPSTTDATRATLTGNYPQAAAAINQQFGTQFTVDAQGNVQVGDITVPAYIALPAAAKGGFSAAVKAAQDYAIGEQGRQQQNRSRQIEDVVTASMLRQRGIDPALFGITDGGGLGSPTPAAATVTPTVQPATPARSGTALDGWIDRRLQQGGQSGVPTQDVSNNPGVSANSTVTSSTPPSAAQPVVPAIPSREAAANDWRSLMTVEPQIPQTPESLSQLRRQASVIEQGRNQAAQSMALYTQIRNNLDQLIRETRGRTDISRKTKNILINGYRQQLQGANQQLMNISNDVSAADTRLRDFADYISAGQQIVSGSNR